MFGGALTVASLLTLLIPFTARANAAPLIANRILLGISEVRIVLRYTRLQLDDKKSRLT